MPAVPSDPSTWCKCEDARKHDPTCPIHTPAVRETRKRMLDFFNEDLSLDGDSKLTEYGIWLTCDGCGNADDCEFAFDPYNTDGDCLAMK